MKWTSATPYTFLSKFKHSQAELNDLLTAKTFEPCNNRQLRSSGWVPPYGDDLLAYETAGCILLKLCTEEKILPDQVIAREMASRIEVLEEKLDRKIRGKEKLDIRDTVVMELTPQAFTAINYDYVLIIPDVDLLLVSSSAAKRCDTVTTILRECVEKLPIAPLKTDLPPAAMFVRWLKRSRKMPSNLTMGAGCKLIDDEGGTVVLTKQAMLSDEFTSLYTSGREVSRLALHWGEGLSFTLSDELVITSLKFSDLNPEDDSQADLDAGGLFDSSLALTGLSLKDAFTGLVEVFGGLNSDLTI